MDAPPNDLRVRVLLGEITPQMRAVSVTLSATEIRMRVYVDGVVPDNVADDFEAGAVTQIAADFPWIESGDPVVGPCEFVRLDRPAPLPQSSGEVYVFMRAEASA